MLLYIINISSIIIFKKYLTTLSYVSEVTIIFNERMQIDYNYSFLWTFDVSRFLNNLKIDKYTRMYMLQ